MKVPSTAQQAQRVAAMVGDKRGLRNEDGTPRAATLPEVKQYIIDALRADVQHLERQAAIAAIADATFDPT